MELTGSYKQSEIGVVPQDWDVAPLVELSKKVTDGDHATPRRESLGYYLLSARNIINGSIDTSDVDFVGEDEYRRMRQRCNPEAGDVLISCSGTIGRIAIVPNDIECVLVRSAALVKIDPKSASGLFLQYWLQGGKAQKQISDSVNQGAQPNLFLNHIERLLCAKPPLPEQTAIATTLSDVDALLAAQDALIAKKRAIKQGAMQELLTGKRRLPGFDGEWEVRRLGKHLEFLSNGANSRAELTNDGRVRYLHYGDIHGANGVFLDPATTAMPFLPAEKATRLDRLRNGDLIFADASEDIDGVGKSVEMKNVDGPEVVSGMHTIAVRFDKAILADGFKAYLQEIPAFHRHLRRLASGTKVYATNMSHIASAELALPEANEQIAITKVLLDMDAEIMSLETQRAKTAQLKQGMMQELLTGRIRLV